MSDKPDAAGTPTGIVIFTEDEYRYGYGTLRLCVERVTVLRSEPGWALVGGVRIDKRGIAREHRDIWVSIATLRQHRLDARTAEDGVPTHVARTIDQPAGSSEQIRPLSI